MDDRRRNVLLAAVSALLIVSLIFNSYQYKRAASMNKAVYDYGFESALVGVTRADAILNGKNYTYEDRMNAVRYVAESAGQFETLSHPMHEMGIDHTMGIGMRLDEAVRVISHPNQYSEAQIELNKQFIHVVTTAFKPCWYAQYLIKSRLPSAINKIYDAMTLEERQQLYPMY